MYVVVGEQNVGEGVVVLEVEEVKNKEVELEKEAVVVVVGGVEEEQQEEAEAVEEK